jgi:hypothetical protein
MSKDNNYSDEELQDETDESSFRFLIETKRKKAKEEMNKMKKEFENILKIYLDGNPVIQTSGKSKEFEIRFGTNTRESRPLSKIDYDNVVKTLYANGFVCDNYSGIQILRVIPDYLDTKTGEIKQSNIRAEIVGTDLIQEYCRTNDVNKLLNMPSTSMNKIFFTQKMSIKTDENTYLKPVDMNDMNFRADFKLEATFDAYSKIIKTMRSSWNSSKKAFRCMNRVRFHHPEFPLFADLSIIKASKKKGRDYIREYTIQDADVFNKPETYEIELELDNTKVGPGTDFNTAEKVMDAIRKTIRIVLCGLQGTNYPIPFSERNAIQQYYMSVLHGETYQPRDVNGSDFIGPQSVTLQLENVVEPTENTVSRPNIRKNYTVTDKADGERRLLYVNYDGTIYLLDGMLNVIFTGMRTTNQNLFNSVLDGEHIKRNKHGDPIQLFAAFDVYFIKGKNIRSKAFLPTTDATSSGEETVRQNYRLMLLNDFIEELKPVSLFKGKKEQWKEVVNNNGVSIWMEIRSGIISKTPPIKSIPCNLRIQCKTFYATSDENTIFDGCYSIFQKESDGSFEYETDGLIFTPSNTGVGSDVVGKESKLAKREWPLSFKWKPAEFNTVDFLVNVKKDEKTNKEGVYMMFDEGSSCSTNGSGIVQYKTLHLLCGFDEKEHGNINAFNDIIQDTILKADGDKDHKKYRPQKFIPMNPYDPEAYICNIQLTENGSSGSLVAENGDIFTDYMIVEFRFDKTAPRHWQWKPIRVRYDKTTELLRTMRNFGNAYHVANNNWKSIHYEVSKSMLESGSQIPEEVEEVYYQRENTNDRSTSAMRNFHNLYVKKSLICNVANVGDILIDYSVGKGGDIFKWCSARLKFVYGIDLSRDNIFNPYDGACVRYVETYKKRDNIPGAIFVNGDSSRNIRDGSAFGGDKDSKNTIVSRAIFGEGPKDETILGRGVFPKYGIADQGFNISSCQFSLHYFFESHKKLHGFLRNLSECTRIQGYFVGTCYDGQTIFNTLSKKKEGEGLLIKDRRTKSKICEIIKLYDHTGFEDDETSIGYPIGVYQDSINKTIREYLVNFNYFNQLMGHYGFTLISKEEANQLGLPNGSGLFDELFDKMKKEISMNPESAVNYREAPNMSKDEKLISYMNRYFVYRKTHKVNAINVGKLLMRSITVLEGEDDDIQVLEEKREIEEQLQSMEKAAPAVTKQIRKLKNVKVIIREENGPETESSDLLNIDFPETETKKSIPAPDHIQSIAVADSAETVSQDLDEILGEELAEVAEAEAKPLVADGAIANKRKTKEPKVPKVPKVPKEPKAPKAPKVPKAPKEPKAPKVPKATKTQEKAEKAEKVEKMKKAKTSKKEKETSDDKKA